MFELARKIVATIAAITYLYWGVMCFGSWIGLSAMPPIPDYVLSGALFVAGLAMLEWAFPWLTKIRTEP